MTTANANRRRFLALATGTLGGLCCPALRAAQAQRLSFIWWGSPERADLTQRALNAFQASHPRLGIDTEYLDWLDYWQRFVALVATRKTPDLIQMDYRYLKLYAENGVLMPLDAYLGGLLDIESFGRQNIDACRIDGRLYGVNLGINSTAAIVDSGSWLAAGVEPPAIGTSWEMFGSRCAAFAKGNKQQHRYATSDASGAPNVFESWLRQRGKGLFDREGRPGFNTEDAVEWFDYWARLRSFGGCIPADLHVLYRQSIQTSPLIRGYAALDFAHSNMLPGYQQLTTRPLDITAYPVTDGGHPGHYYKPSQMLSIAADSRSAEPAVELANFLVMSPEAVRMLGVDRGIPASSTMRKVLATQLDKVGQKTLDYIDNLAPLVGPLPPPPPQGAGEFAILFQNIGHEVAFKQLTPKKGGEKLFREAVALLSQ